MRSIIYKSVLGDNQTSQRRLKWRLLCCKENHRLVAVVRTSSMCNLQPRVADSMNTTTFFIMANCAICAMELIQHISVYCKPSRVTLQWRKRSHHVKCRLKKRKKRERETKKNIVHLIVAVQQFSSCYISSSQVLHFAACTICTHW